MEPNPTHDEAIEKIVEEFEQEFCELDVVIGKRTEPAKAICELPDKGMKNWLREKLSALLSSTIESVCGEIEGMKKSDLPQYALQRKEKIGRFSWARGYLQALSDLLTLLRSHYQPDRKV